MWEKRARERTREQGSRRESMLMDACLCVSEDANMGVEKIFMLLTVYCSEETLDPNKTPMETLQSMYENVKDQEARNHLGTSLSLSLTNSLRLSFDALRTLSYMSTYVSILRFSRPLLMSVSTQVPWVSRMISLYTKSALSPEDRRVDLLLPSSHIRSLTSLSWMNLRITLIWKRLNLC